MFSNNKKSRFFSHSLIVTLLVGVIITAVGCFLIINLDIENFLHSRFREILELLVASSALIVMLVVYFNIKLLRLNRYEIKWITSGLGVMCIFDLFHVVSPSDSNFIWLHGATSAAGGLLFFLTTLQRKKVSQRHSKFPFFAIIISVIICVISILYPEHITPILEKDIFHHISRTLNAIGSICFFLSYIFFYKQFTSRNFLSRYILSILCLLFASSSIVFEISLIWDSAWWLWHVMHFVTYVILIVFVLFLSISGIKRFPSEIMEHKALRYILPSVISFAIALVAMDFLFITELKNQRDSMEIDKFGIRYHAKLLELLIDAQEYRGAYFVFRQGDKNFQEFVNNKRKEILIDIKDIDIIDNELGVKLDTTDTWKDIKNAFNNIEEKRISLSPLESFESDTEFIDKIISMMKHIGNTSSLITTNNLDSHYLINIVLHIIPSFTEAIGKIRGRIAGALIEHNMSFRPNEEDEIYLFALYGNVTEYYKEFIISANMALDENETIKEELISSVKETKYVYNTFIEELSYIIKTHESGISTENFFAKGTNVIRSFTTLYYTVSNSLYQLLQRRIDDKLYKEQFIYTLSLIIIVATAAFYILYHRNFIRRHNAEHSLIQVNRGLERKVGIRTLELQKKNIINELLHNIVIARNVEKALQISIEEICDYTGWPIGHVYMYNENTCILEPTKIWHIKYVSGILEFKKITEETSFVSGVGLPGRVLETKKPLWISMLDDDNFPRAKYITNAGLNTVFAFPVLVHGGVVAVLEFFSKNDKRPTLELLKTIEYIGTQIGFVIERTIAKEKAEESNKYKSDFLANMSHELRTPLNSILLLSNMLFKNKKQHLDEREADSARIIYNAGNDLLSLINDILDLSKIEAGKMMVSLQSVSLAAFSEKIEMYFRSIAEDKVLNFEIHLDDDLPQTITTDEQRLEQIIRNFISNSFKFTKKGEVVVKIFRPHDISFLRNKKILRNSVIAISVSDTGIGISEEKHIQIFEAFNQADTGTQKKFGGTGLGLSISNKLSKILEGEITLESEEKKGSTFTLYIPENLNKNNNMRNIDYKRIPKNDSDFINDTTIGSINELVAGKTILIVDDDRRNVFALSNTFKTFKINILEAYNGIEAIAQLKNNPSIDLVLMDIMMPEMDGYEAIKKIREDEKYENLHIIAITAKAMSDDMKKCLEAGADDYISKPLEINKLMNMVSKYI